MKKILVLFLALFSASIVCQAQKKNWHKTELYTAYGVGSFQEVFNNLKGGISSSFTNPEKATISIAGPFVLGFNHETEPRFFIGVNIAYTNTGLDVLYTNGNWLRNDLKYYSFMSTATFQYVSRTKFKMYSSIFLGASFISERIESTNEFITKKSRVFPAVQIDLIGFKLGERFGLFTNIGLGNIGTLSGGIFFKP